LATIYELGTRIFAFWSMSPYIYDNKEHL
jgi:hypothetical protein